ncbi:hypothetical protein [Ligilactobacillus salivarius]|nr:hypothetical protein [Ligilactobacillus salivarius]
MKKYLIFILSIVVALLTWIPNTRLFLIFVGIFLALGMPFAP